MLLTFELLCGAQLIALEEGINLAEHCTANLTNEITIPTPMQALLAAARHGALVAE